MVSDAILLGSEHGKNYSKCMGKFKWSMPNNLRVINFLGILCVAGKR